MSDKEQAFNRYQNESSADTIARLERELAAARRDAERYRWLRERGNFEELADYVTAFFDPDGLDSAIDNIIAAARPSPP